MVESIIKVSNLSKKYDELAILDDFSLEVKQGEMVAILGESGCGKTTLLRIIAGFVKEDKGQVYLNGLLMNDKIAPNERNVAMVFQEPTLWNHMSVLKNIAYGMNTKNNEKIFSIMENLGINGLEKRYPEELSGGQAKRVALARALASDKEILFLDEPLSNIDSDTKEKILRYIEKDFKGRKTILYVTHNRDEADFFGCRQVKMGKRD